MLATPTMEPPTGDGWAWEMKWDGVRALAGVEAGALRLVNRRGGEITHRYPELHALGDALRRTDVLLDGELAIFDGPRPDFQLMQRRMHVDAERDIQRLAAELPAVLMIFDLLWLDGHATISLPYAERRRFLLELGLVGAAWQTPPHEVGDGSATLAVVGQFALEGAMAKRLDSVYVPGRRARTWLKWKRHLRQELVVGGWMPGLAGRAGRLGSLLVGYYERAGPSPVLTYAGRVGTGFTQDELDRLGAKLEPLRRATSPFGAGTVPKAAVFVEPALVVEVRFTEWTAGGSIRQPAYLGERDDKDPTEVGRELPA
jgi:bifunctional non-homologous end joining protein LigD